MDENTKPQDDGVKTDGTATPTEGGEATATPTEGGEAATE